MHPTPTSSPTTFRLRTRPLLLGLLWFGGWLVFATALILNVMPLTGSLREGLCLVGMMGAAQLFFIFPARRTWLQLWRGTLTVDAEGIRTRWRHRRWSTFDRYTLSFHIRETHAISTPQEFHRSLQLNLWCGAWPQLVVNQFVEDYTLLMAIVAAHVPPVPDNLQWAKHHPANPRQHQPAALPLGRLPSSYPVTCIPRDYREVSLTEDSLSITYWNHTRATYTPDQFGYRQGTGHAWLMLQGQALINLGPHPEFVAALKATLAAYHLPRYQAALAAGERVTLGLVQVGTDTVCYNGQTVQREAVYTGLVRAEAVRLVDRLYQPMLTIPHTDVVNPDLFLALLKDCRPAVTLLDVLGLSEPL